MQDWKRVWRLGIVPLLSRRELEALRDGLERDDERLCQGWTAGPVGVDYRPDRPIAYACPLAYAGWKAGPLATVGEAEDYFAAVCIRADLLLGEPAGCRWLTNFIDETPRAEMREALLGEVLLALEAKEA